MLNPEEFHRRNHFRGYVVPAECCWYCQRAEAICKSKRSYVSAQAASEACIAHLIGTDRLVLPYRCRYCERWHLATPRQKHKQRKAEKMRRKWLRKKAESERPDISREHAERILAGPKPEEWQPHAGIAKEWAEATFDAAAEAWPESDLAARVTP